MDLDLERLLGTGCSEGMSRSAACVTQGNLTPTNSHLQRPCFLFPTYIWLCGLRNYRKTTEAVLCHLPPPIPNVQPSCLQPTCPPGTGKFSVRSHKALD